MEEKKKGNKIVLRVLFFLFVLLVFREWEFNSPCYKVFLSFLVLSLYHCVMLMKNYS